MGLTFYLLHLSHLPAMFYFNLDALRYFGGFMFEISTMNLLRLYNLRDTSAPYNNRLTLSHFAICVNFLTIMQYTLYSACSVLRHIDVVRTTGNT